MPIYQTDLKLYEGEDWPTTSHAAGQPPVLCPDHEVTQYTIKLRRIGWIDQKGRVYKETPTQAGFDGGSLTPLLINPGCD